jgi:hypothetical protein
MNIRRTRIAISLTALALLVTPSVAGARTPGPAQRPPAKGFCLNLSVVGDGAGADCSPISV